MIAAPQPGGHPACEHNAEPDPDTSDPRGKPSTLRRELPGGNARDRNPDDCAAEPHHHEGGGEHWRVGCERRDRKTRGREAKPDFDQTNQRRPRSEPGNDDRSHQVRTDIERAEQPGRGIGAIQEVITGLGEDHAPGEPAERLRHHRRGQHDRQGQDATFRSRHPTTLAVWARQDRMLNSGAGLRRVDAR